MDTLNYFIFLTLHKIQPTQNIHTIVGKWIHITSEFQTEFLVYMLQTFGFQTERHCRDTKRVPF